MLICDNDFYIYDLEKVGLALIMKVEVREVTESSVDEIPGICKQCLYWSFPEKFRKTGGAHPIHRALKKDWIIQTQREFGSCGKILYYDNVPVGYVEYGPSDRFPQIKTYKSKPIGNIEDGVVFLSCLFIADKNLRGKKLGKKLLESVIADLKRRGFKAIETYARRGSSNNPSGPVEFYLESGFDIKDESDPEFLIVRLSL